MEINTDILVLGAGLSGLAAADRLKAGGKKVFVLEKEEKEGGLAATVSYKGFKFDLGGHRLYFKDAEVRARVEKLLGPGKTLSHKRKSSIYTRGRFLQYPPTLLNGALYALQTLGFKKRNAGKTGEAPASLKEWLDRNFGSRIHDAYFKDYSFKAWGLPTEEISSIWAERRIGNLDIKKLFFDMFLPSSGAKENAGYFLYPEDGIGSLSAALRKKLRDEEEIITGAVPVGFTAEGRILTSLKFEKNGRRDTVKFKRLISTIPLKGFSALIPDDPELAGAARDLRYRSLIVVFLALRERAPLKDHWVYFQDPDVSFARASELVNWSRGLAPEGFFPVTLEIFCQEGDETWRKPDAEIAAETFKALSAIKIFEGSELADFKVERLPFAYPLLYLGYEKPLNAVKKVLARYTNLELCGRSGAHSYYDMEECLLDADRAAASAAGKLG